MEKLDDFGNDLSNPEGASPSQEISDWADRAKKSSKKRLAEPWRHSIATALPVESQTTRMFDPDRQRFRLLTTCLTQWLITLALCAILILVLWGFSKLLTMTVALVKVFNALITLLSIFLGANLTSSMRSYALMLRWRVLAGAYRPLAEIDLILECESLRKLLKLFWISRTPGRRLWLNRTQWHCVLWLGLNLALQVLVALLGLTYNLSTSHIPEKQFGHVSVVDLSVIRDVWGDRNPSFSAQLGSANYYGIQGQDYLFVNNLTVPGQGSTPSYGTPSTPKIYEFANDTVNRYYFFDADVENPQLTILSHRSIDAQASCEELQVTAGGNGIEPLVSYIGPEGQHHTLDVVRTGPGAVTYVGILNSTCGARCSQLLALQAANNDTIMQPSFFKCQSTLSQVAGVEIYTKEGQKASRFKMPDEQARILAGSIGWTGFNYTAGDSYQYVRYTTESYWSPNTEATAEDISARIMEFAIEAVAAMDYNGPRQVVRGYYPIIAQSVTVDWKWSGAVLGIIPFLQFVALIGVVFWANAAIIRDESCLSTARLLKPMVDHLGDKGCLLTGKEIAEFLGQHRFIYGHKEQMEQSGVVWRNDLGDDNVVRHVGLISEQEGRGAMGRFPPGLYDGLQENDAEGSKVDSCTCRHRRRHPNGE